MINLISYIGLLSIWCFECFEAIFDWLISKILFSDCQSNASKHLCSASGPHQLSHIDVISWSNYSFVILLSLLDSFSDNLYFAFEDLEFYLYNFIYYILHFDVMRMHICTFMARVLRL